MGIQSDPDGSDIEYKRAHDYRDKKEVRIIRGIQKKVIKRTIPTDGDEEMSNNDAG